MLLKKIKLTFFLLPILSHAFSQTTCHKNNLEDINTIGKCHIANFKNSNRSEYIRINTVKKKKNKRRFKKIRREVLAFVEQKKSETLVSSFVSFDKVDQRPIFIDCADYDKATRQECVKELMAHSILDNLIYPFDAASEGIAGRVWVRFIINTAGYVKNITTKGFKNSELLDQEAKRLIKLLPKFIPGKHNNNYVNVEYFIPINFQLTTND